MSNSEGHTSQPPKDARFCPSCGEELPLKAVRFYSDTLLDRYRAVFMCPDCGYDGEVIRGGGIEDLSIHLTKSGSNRIIPVMDGEEDG